MNEPDGKIFDANLVTKRRERAARDWQDHDFLKRETVARLLDRLADVKREFPLALDLGCHAGEFAEAARGHPAIGRVISADGCFALAARADHAVVCDPEWLPFAENRFDLVVSALSLHHVNDLPGVLIQLQRCLKPDGLLMITLPGASTLRQLRHAIIAASAADGLALSPRLSPLIEVRDAGGLLQRAGFALPVADTETITLEYDHPLRLLHELRGMGETNPLLAQHKGVMTRAQLAGILDHYPLREDGTVEATVELVTLTGWKPHASQAQPLRRGSGKVSMAEALKPRG